MVGTQEDENLAQRVLMSLAGALLAGELWLPPNARGLVLLPHGRGTQRGQQDFQVAAALRGAGLGTLLVDLLTAEEADLDAARATFRFDIGLLAGRLALATDWLIDKPWTRDLCLGYFGAGYGAAAALVAAADRPGKIGAVVAHDGLPDCAERVLTRLTAPTLLIGGLNRSLLTQLDAGDGRFVLAPGTDHAVDEVAQLAVDWFGTHVQRVQAGAARGAKEKTARVGLSWGSTARVMARV